MIGHAVAKQVDVATAQNPAVRLADGHGQIGFAGGGPGLPVVFAHAQYRVGDVLVPRRLIPDHLIHSVSSYPAGRLVSHETAQRRMDDAPLLEVVAVADGDCGEKILAHAGDDPVAVVHPGRLVVGPEIVGHDTFRMPGAGALVERPGKHAQAAEPVVEVGLRRWWEGIVTELGMKRPQPPLASHEHTVRVAGVRRWWLHDLRIGPGASAIYAVLHQDGLAGRVFLALVDGVRNVQCILILIDGGTVVKLVPVVVRVVGLDGREADIGQGLDVAAGR